MNNLQAARNDIQHIMLEFQLGDLKKCAQANFLVAIGLMTSTEFLGGLITGTLRLKNKNELGRYRRELRDKNPVEYRFEEGFKYLGKPYKALLKQKKGTVMDIYENIRCGLVHQYLPPQTEGIYGGKTEGPGIVEINGQFRIIHENYARDLERAIKKLMNNVKKDGDLLQRVGDALGRIPPLA